MVDVARSAHRATTRLLRLGSALAPPPPDGQPEPEPGTARGDGAQPDLWALRSLETRARRARAAERTIRCLFPVLAAGMLGVLLLLVGLAWDARVHARDPEAAHVETSLLSLANPSHGLMLAGGALAVASLTTATVRALGVSRSRWLASRPARAAVVVAVLAAAATTLGAVYTASDVELPVASGPLAPAPGPENHRIGLVNSHAPGECRPTKAEKAAAAKLVADTTAATAKFASMEAAIAAGYGGLTTAPVGATEHFGNWAHLVDGTVLDPNRPESLLYTFTPKGPVLIGVMYLMNYPGEFGPEVGGCLTRWHVHTNVCWSPTFQVVKELNPGETCNPGSFLYVPPPALHVWLADVPGGRFAAEVEAQDLLRVASRI